MVENVQYKQIPLEEVTEELLRGFCRHQTVTKVWRKRCGEWTIVDDPFVDDWTEQDRRRKLNDFRKAAGPGGFLAGAFIEGRLAGFCIMNDQPFGSRGQYVELSSLHVSEDMRGRGIGRRLFAMAEDHARRLNAERMYISAHSAVESQAFYRAMGCREAEEYSAYHVAKEPCDCQMERVLAEPSGSSISN